MNEKAIIDKLFEHDKEFGAIQNVITDKFDRVLTGLDQQMVILSRLDQERIFTNEAVRRLEAAQEEQQKEINRIKKVLKIA